MANPTFDTVLDQCLDEVRAGRLTVQQCLDRWPQHAAALEPVLRAALAVTELALPMAPPDPARRAAFMTALRETPQQRPQAWRRALRAFALPLGGLLRLGAVLVPAAAIAAAAIVLVLGRGGSTAEASTLTVFAGNAERVEGSGWVPLHDGERLPEGTRLRTDAAGRVLVTFVDGSTVAVDPQTELTIERAQASGVREIALRQWSGRLWSQVAHDERANASFTVRTADATVVAQGTVFETAIADGETAVSTAEGTVEVQTQRERVRVAAGDAVRARLQALLPRVAARAGAPAAVTVSAPFVASLIGPDGRATGALPDGAVYQQIPGALSSDPGAGAQRIVLGDVASGEYTLILRRVGSGAGTMVVETEGRERTLPLAAGAETYTLRIRATTTPAQTVLAFEGGVQVTPTDRLAQRERLVIPERVKQALERLREQRRLELERRQQQQQSPVATPALRPFVTPTAPTRVVPTATVTPTR
jgi:ferric-dicitrate binding protein FerR (iron transport regulator)